MGGNLIAEDAQPISFIAWATKDPNSAPLQRLQIIKGWVDASGQSHEQVVDVAGDADNGAGVDPNNCQRVGRGEAQLCAVWQDPDFDPAVPAFYYARVIENPTCRWSTWDALRAGVEPRDDLPRTLQERSWSSPIWIIPGLKKNNLKKKQ